MTKDELNKINNLGFNERQKLECVLGKYMDIEHNNVIMDITRFDEMLSDIIQFYSKNKGN